MACISCIYLLKRIIMKIFNGIPDIKNNRCISYCCINVKKLDELIEKYKNDQVNIKRIKIKRTISNLIHLLHEIDGCDDSERVVSV